MDTGLPCFTSIPINHTSYIRKLHVTSGGGGEHTPCTLSLHMPLSEALPRRKPRTDCLIVAVKPNVSLKMILMN